MEPSHIFQLPSGVEAEVREFTGKHQRILTQQGKSKKMADLLNEVLVDVIVRIGDEKQIDDKFLKNMLSADRSKILVEIRQYTLGNPETFDFTYEYLSEGGKKNLELEVACNFPTTTYKVVGADGKLVDAEFRNYDEIEKEYEVTLPKSGEVVKLYLLDGEKELAASKIKKSDRSSHTPIIMRNPRKFRKTDSGETPMLLDLDRTSIPDIEFLRKTIKEREGRVDTEIMFEHPEAETKGPNEKEVVVDVLTEKAFFFPSEAI